MRRAFTLLEVLSAMGLVLLLSLLVGQFIRWFLPNTTRMSARSRLQAFGAQILGRLRADSCERLPGGMWILAKPDQTLLVIQTPRGRTRAAAYGWNGGAGLKRYELPSDWLQSQGIQPSADLLEPLALGSTHLEKWLVDLKDLKASRSWGQVEGFELSALPNSSSQIGKVQIRFRLEEKATGRPVVFEQGICLP